MAAFDSSRRRFILALPVWAMTGAVGCAPFQVNDESPKGRLLLPPPKLAPGSVVLEIAHAQLPVTDQAGYDEVWNQTDEQSLSLALRTELARNGLRSGILGQTVPEKIRQLMSQKIDVAEQRSEDLDVGEVEVDRQIRRLQCRTGRRAKILCSKTFPELSLLTRDNGSVRGRQLYKAQCLFGMKPYPEADGRVRIDLIPEVEHGEVKQQWVGGEGTLMQRIGRDRITFEQLRMSLTLAPGQTLVVSACQDAKGLGEHFFVESVGGTKSRSMLFVRVAHTQHDDLFAPELSGMPLATPSE